MYSKLEDFKLKELVNLLRLQDSAGSPAIAIMSYLWVWVTSDNLQSQSPDIGRSAQHSPEKIERRGHVTYDQGCDVVYIFLFECVEFSSV